MTTIARHVDRLLSLALVLGIAGCGAYDKPSAEGAQAEAKASPAPAVAVALAAKPAESPQAKPQQELPKANAAQEKPKAISDAELTASTAPKPEVRPPPAEGPTVDRKSVV